MTRVPRWTGDEPCAHGDPDLPFAADIPGLNDELAEMRGLCAGCPTLEPCLRYAMVVDVHGVWGGSTYAERARERRRVGLIPEPVRATPAAATGGAAPKLCPRCGQTRPAREFHRNGSRPDGLHGWCRVCTNAARTAS